MWRSYTLPAKAGAAPVQFGFCERSTVASTKDVSLDPALCLLSLPTNGVM